MKQILTVLFFGAVCATPGIQAQECEIPVAIYLTEQTEPLPTAVESYLTNSLKRVALQGGLNTDLSYTQFFLTARIDVLDKSVLPGPPIQVVQNLGVTLYVADLFNQKIFTSSYIELNGVGNNETKSMMNAVQRLNANRAEVKMLLDAGKKRIIEYYDTNYPQILKRAQQLMSLQQYDEALSQVISIPPCCKGYDEAIRFGLVVYQKYMDTHCASLLAKARVAWAANQNQQGASLAGSYLVQIDPEAACYPEAMLLYNEIKTQVRSDLDFEIRQKYNDEIALEKQRITAIQAIGVAFGKGQQPKTTHINWIR